jgi:hypothetical protein
MKTTLKSIALLMAFVIMAVQFIGCSSTTMINSSPQGAQVYLNGEYKGQTPYKLTDTKTTGAVTEVVLKHDEYATFSAPLVKSEQVNVGAVVGGLFFLFPFIWTMGYSPTHTYILQK